MKIYFESPDQTMAYAIGVFVMAAAALLLGLIC
jgi:hypothetical protein